jgi:hypothetical protein
VKGKQEKFSLSATERPCAGIYCICFTKRLIATRAIRAQAEHGRKAAIRLCIPAARKKMATPEDVAKFREETSKKQRAEARCDAQSRFAGGSTQALFCSAA